MIMFISAVLLGRLLIAQSLKIEDSLRVVDLLRSKDVARVQYKSELLFHNHIMSHMNALMTDESETQQHAFIVTVKPGFDATEVINRVGNERFGIVNEHNYEVWAKPAVVKEIVDRFSSDVEAVVPLVPAMKIDPHVYKLASLCENKETTRRSLLVSVAALSENELDMFNAWVNVTSKGTVGFTFEGDLYPNQRRAFIVEATCSSILHVARLVADTHEVYWIEEHGEVKHCNYWARGVMESGAYSNQAILLTGGLTGVGQVIGISDTGLDLSSTYFYDNSSSITYNSATPNLVHRKVVSYTFRNGASVYGDAMDNAGADGESGFHGTHVCGTSVGRAFDDYGDYKRFDGVAPDAKVAFYDIQNGSNSSLKIPANLNTDLFAVMHGMGARVFSNSWGQVASSGYDSRSMYSDQFMYAHQDSLVLFAAGNNGDSRLTPGVSNSVLSPATFKNGLTVGAGLNDHQSWLSYSYGTAGDVFNPSGLASFSSRGPTSDGRIKPEVVAPGYTVTSALGKEGVNLDFHTGVTGKAGTSMATPAAAGMAAIARQYFMQGYYTATGNKTAGFVPLGALLKAMLISAAQPMTSVVATYDGGASSSSTAINAWPGNDQGYGRIQLNLVLNFGPSSSDPLSLFVVGDSSSTSPSFKQFTLSGQVHSYTFRVATTQTVRITLAYSDKEGVENSATIVQNDITISLSSSTEVVNPIQQSKNTFKVIKVTATAGVLYTVTVTAKTIVAPFSQPYALVIVSQDIQQLAAASPDQPLLQNNLSIDEVPFVPAIIGMACISFLILIAVVTILIANWCSDRLGFKVLRW